jgi:putative nucleotidyltransferase with HDIG domain
LAEEKVLVVDDEEVICNLCAQILSGNGYEVTAVRDGFKAIEEAKRRPFDLLLTDIKMPGIGGLEVHQAVKEIRDDITTVVITGHGTIDLAIESLKRGIEGFVLKPFTHAELLNTVEYALEKGRLARENMRLKALLPLLEINRALVTDVKQEEMLDAIMDVALSEIKADRISIMLLDEDTQELVVRASKGISIDKVKGFRTKIGKGVSGLVAQTGEAVILNDGVHSNPVIQDSMKLNEIHSGMCVPLIIKGKTLGVISLSKINQLSPFTKCDLDLFSIIAGQLAVSLENSRLYSEIRENYFKTILALAAAIEAKDPYTRGHSAQVARYALAIAEEMGLPREKIEEIHIAGILHDVGKIGITEQVLCKPGKLTDEEYAIMKEHPFHGERILDPIGFPEEIIKSIRHHHEWYDGRGYPDGLKGEDISLGARILCVADTIEAMTSERYYRDILSLARVIRELRDGAGSQFDPEIVDAALRLIERGKIQL